MPKRPKSHQLETESINEFQRILPSGWTFNKETEDYGIDGRVDIFKDEQSIGLFFFVQIKSSEESKSLTLEKDHISYYMKYDTPVLIAKYVKNENSFYMRWVSEIYLCFSEKEFFKEKTQNSFSFTFEEKFKYKSDFWGELELHLKNLRDISKEVLPLSVFLKFTKLGKNTLELKSGIIENINELKKFLKIESSELDSLISISLEKKHLKVILLKKAMCYFQIRNTNQDYIRAICIMGIVFCLCRFNRFDLGRSIFFENKESLVKWLPKNKEVILKIFLMLYSHYPKDILNFISSYCINDHFPVGFFHFIYITANDCASEKKVFLKKILEFYKEKGDKPSIGTSYYNLGNFYRGIDLKQSLDYYEKAFDNNKGYYSKQSYYFSEKAGLFWELGNYKESSENYKKAIELDSKEENIQNLALYADALLYDGQYLNACKKFENFLQREGVDTYYWQLKYYCVKNLILKEFKIENQRRNTEKANSFLNDDIDNKDKLDLAIRQDALSGLALFNRGIFFSNSNDYLKSMMSFLLCALIQTWDVEAWVNAIIQLFNIDTAKKKLNLFSKEQLFLMIITEAYRHEGEKFVQKLYEMINNQPEENFQKNGEALKKAIDKILNFLRVDNSNEVREVRLIHWTEV